MTSTTHTRALVAAMSAALMASAPADAQSLGEFTWQLQPFCNRVTVQVTQNGSLYTLDGYDDQCGAAQRAPLVGMATPNPDGTIGFGLHIVTAPGGKSVHVDARISVGTFGGPWTDSAGNSGTLVLGGNATGSARPLPSGAPAWGTVVQADGASATSPVGLSVSISAPAPTAGAAIAAQWGTAPVTTTTAPSALLGKSQDRVGVVGASDNSVGVVGISHFSAGVAGQSVEGPGVWALSETGPALVAEVSGTGANIALGLGNGGIVVAGAARPAFQHTTSAGSVTAPNGTRIDHPLTNGDPTAMLFLTHAFVSGAAVYWTHPTGVYYNAATARWEIYAEDNTALPMGLRFNVLVIKVQ